MRGSSALRVPVTQELIDHLAYLRSHNIGGAKIGRLLFVSRAKIKQIGKRTCTIEPELAAQILNLKLEDFECPYLEELEEARKHLLWLRKNHNFSLRAIGHYLGIDRTCICRFAQNQQIIIDHSQVKKILAISSEMTQFKSRKGHKSL